MLATNENQIEPAGTAQSERVLLARAADHACALRLSDVVEVMRPLPIEQVAGAPEAVLGVSVIRGAPVPIVALATLLGSPERPFRRLVVVRVGGRRVALAVEGVIGIRDLESSSFNTLPPLLQDTAASAIEAIGRLDSELLFVLEAGRLLPDDVWELFAAPEN